MTKLYKLLVSAAFMLLPLTSYAGGTPCSRDGTGAIDTAVTVNCGTTPQAYDVTIYKLALCRANPTLGTTPDFSSCAMLIDGAGQLAHMAAGSSVVLATSSVPPNGTYGYAVMVASNSLGITSTQRYSTPMTGSAGGVGTTCWSVTGTVIKQSPTPAMVACGVSASPGVTIDKLDHFNNGGPGDPSVGGTFNGQSTSATVIGGTIIAKLATSSLATAVAADWPNGITRIIALQTFNTGSQIKIDATTRGLDISFDVSNSSSPWITGGAGGTIQQFGTGPFSMVITVK